LNGVAQAVGCPGGIRKLSGLSLSRRTSFRNLSFPYILYALACDAEVVLWNRPRSSSLPPAPASFHLAMYAVIFNVKFNLKVVQ